MCTPDDDDVAAGIRSCRAGAPPGVLMVTDGHSSTTRTRDTLTRRAPRTLLADLAQVTGLAPVLCETEEGGTEGDRARDAGAPPCRAVHSFVFTRTGAVGRGGNSRQARRARRRPATPRGQRGAPDVLTPGTVVAFILVVIRASVVNLNLFSVDDSRHPFGRRRLA